MKKLASVVGVTGLVAVGILVPTATSHASDLGGWNEGSGSSESHESGVVSSSASTGLMGAGTPNHRGKVETKVIKGTTNKRAHGWTTWTGVKHYTTAQLERGNGAVITSSGRKWGVNGTEAISDYRAINPKAADSGWGHAKTYYGK
jgi:hypothetical protein